MTKPLEWFIGLRYLRARRPGQYVSFISLASMLGIALGVAALIVILSVMNGFETELRTRLLSMTAHATVSGDGAPLNDWQSVQQNLKTVPEVSATAPYVAIEGMLAFGNSLSGAMVRGVLPSVETGVSRVAEFMLAGELNELTPGSNHIILGRVLALNLGVRVGDRIRLLVPRMERGRLSPRLSSFVVTGVFEAGIQDHDGSMALVHLDDAAGVLGWTGGVSGVRAQLSDPLTASVVAPSIRDAVGPDLSYSDWTIENRSYFRAVRIEKAMMAVLLMLIVAVAAFNIVASLVMVVTDKEQDIAILRTMGLDPDRVGRLFVVQGAVIGLVGTVLGVLLGLTLALNVDVVVPWLEQTFGFQIMPGDVYYVTEIPSEIHWLDVVLIPLVAFALTILATVYPSRRAAAVAPAEALRYE